LTKLLYPLFPRQIAVPFRTTVDRGEFYQKINLFNGKKRIFSSIYNFTGNFEYDNQAMVIDKIFFDFDGENALINALALIEECVKRDYKFTVFFSGAGFHVYIFTNRARLANPKFALAAFQTQYQGMDKTSIGDIARVATVPNTFNTKRGRFCIPVSIEDVKKGIDYIYELAALQRYEAFVYGNTPVDLVKYDGRPEERYAAFDEPRIDVRKIESLPPCINDILSYEKKGFRGRFLIIVYLKDAGYLKHQIEDVIKEYCSDDEAKHCIYHERQLNYLYWKDMMFPYCEVIKSEGKCPCDGICEFTRPYNNKTLVKIYR